MKSTRLGSAVPILALALAAAPPAAAPLTAQSSDLLVSVDWVRQHLEDENLVLIHVGDADNFAGTHIPGAVFIAREDFSDPSSHGQGSLILELPEAQALQASLRRLGVNDDSQIVVYWADEWVTPTARVVFTLDWAGLGDRTRLLNGGLTAWSAAGAPVSSEATTPAAGDVTVRPRADLVVDAGWVEAHAGDAGIQVVDARSGAYFDGVSEDRGKAGHIPGAGSLPWTELVDETTLLVHPADRLETLFAGAGVEDGDTVVGYCHIGQYATMMLFAARLLGHEVKLYDGAMQDWAARDLPVEAGS